MASGIQPKAASFVLHATDKSFLVLFFKKELLPAFLSSVAAAQAIGAGTPATLAHLSSMSMKVLPAVLAAIAVVIPPARAANGLPPSTASVDLTSKQAQDQARTLATEPPVQPVAGHRIVADRSGRKQVGTASVYSQRFQGRHMANGRRFDHRGNAAASKSLPLGTVAKVTNTETGRTALVKVQDHGPYVSGRTLDVSRSTARQLGISRHEGVAPVVVAPVAVPQQDGEVKVGAGALPGPATAK